MTKMTQRENINRPDETVRELVAGLLAAGVTMGLILLFFFRDIKILIAVCCGSAAALFMALHMYRSISNALDLSEGDAVSLVRRHAVIRYAVVLIGAVLVFKFVGKPYGLGYIPGVFTLKLGAYLQPLVHRAFVALGLSAPYPEAQAIE